MGTVIGFAGSVLAYSTATGGRAVPLNLTTVTMPIIPINPSRQSIIFHNPGTATAYVAPLTNASGAVFFPGLSNLGGCFTVVPGGTLVLQGEVQCAFQAFATAIGSPFTAMESNV